MRIDYLMSSANEIKIVLVQECFDDIRTENEGDSSLVFSPTSSVLHWIGPQ